MVTAMRTRDRRRLSPVAAGLVVALAVFLLPLAVNAAFGDLDEFHALPMLFGAAVTGLVAAAATYLSRRRHGG